MHQSTLRTPLRHTLRRTGLLLDGVSLVETKQGLRVRVEVRGVASLFEYDPPFVEGLTGLKRVSVRICSYGQSLITPTICFGITIDYSSNPMVET